LTPKGVLDVFNTRSPSSRHAGEQAFQRMYARTQDRDQPTTWTTRQAQYDAVCAWGIPDHALLQRLPAISQPVFVANGDSDPMILPHYSYPARRLDPAGSGEDLPDSAHGFLFQRHTEFAADVEAFLSDPGQGRSAQIS
jgi:pimeloyl-ACP methyl ester carboxylesterase